MLLALSLIALITALSSALFAYPREPSTVTYLAKLTFYVCLLFFLSFLFIWLFSTLPQPEHTSALGGP